jgi:hypothetical protein
MQAGQKARAWVLEFEPAGRRRIELLMGWTATDDPFAQIRLTFPTLTAAVDYAERQGLDYRVIEPSAKRRARKSHQETLLGPGPRNGRVRQAAAGKTRSAISARIRGQAT